MSARLCLLTLALSVACGHGLGERPCTDGSDCPSPQQCIAGRCAGSGFCVGSAACNDDAACGEGQHCANGCCIPGEAGSCARDADCSAHPDKPVCDASKGACVACLVSRDCGPGKLCKDQVCEALPGCASSRDCVKPTPVCDVQQHACVECLDSGDCFQLTAPNCNAAHHCVAACTGDADCAKPTPRCLDSAGSCVACLTVDDCVAPLQCDPVQNVCVNPSATTCTKEQDCQTNLGAPHCKPGTGGKPGTCVACIDDTQCAAGEVCTAGNTCVADQCPLGDADCNAPTPKCLVGATPQVCVACLTSPDCPNGGVCQPDHTCVAASGCQQCVPPTPACDTATSTCVGCTDDSWCSAGETCNAAHTCVSKKCVSDNDCTSLPQTPHCDTVTGSCAQCVSDGQCPAGNKCAGDACKPVCTAATQAQDCSAATPVCRVSPFPACVQCVVSTDCAANMVCTSGNTCIPATGCTTNADCTNPATPVCSGGNCVQCAADSDCKNGMGCNTSAHTCTLTGGVGQICAPGATCNPGLLCIDEGGPNGPVCRPACDPYALTCAAGTVCSWIGFDPAGVFQGFCSAPNHHAALGAACDPTVGDSCEWNLVCAPISATAGVCRAVCDPTKTGNCGATVCNSLVGAVSGSGTVEKFGYCAAASKWGQQCVTDTPAPTGSAGDCGVDTSGAGTGTALYCAPSFLPAENPQASVLGICNFTPDAATAVGAAGDSCAAHTDTDCRTGVCLSDGPDTCFSGCVSNADCGRDGAATTVFCFDIDFQTPFRSNLVASCEPACRNDADCAALGGGGPGRSCDPQPTHNGSSWRAACAPVAGSGAPGAQCTGGTDCESGICVTGNTLQGIELGQSAPGFVAKDGFCLGSASSATDCRTAGTVFSIGAALPLHPTNGDLGVMGRPNPGACWPTGCTRDAECAGLSADSGTPRVCAPYKTTTVTTNDTATACPAKACSPGVVCNDPSNNPNPGGVYGTNAGIYGPNGKCRQVAWALECAPSLGASKLGAGAACTFSTDCRTGHCLVPATGSRYCFGGCSTTADCLGGTTCKAGSYLGVSANFCQP